MFVDCTRSAIRLPELQWIILGRCDFESGRLCGELTEETDDDTDWQVAKAALASGGPEVDHTTLQSEGEKTSLVDLLAGVKTTACIEYLHYLKFINRSNWRP